MNFIKWLLLAGAAFLLQTQFSFAFGRLNLTVVLVYYYGLKSLGGLNPREVHGTRAELKSLVFGALVGLSEDIISGRLLGPAFLSKGLIGFLTPLFFTDVIFRWTPFWGGVIISFFTVLDGGLVLWAGMLFGGVSVNTAQAVREVFFQGLVNVPLSLMLKR